MVQGLDTVPDDERPTIPQVNTVHLAWDVMVGIGTLLFLLVGLVRAVLAVPARHAEEPLVPAHRVRRRRAAVITMEAGWVVTEVGRQPWIVYDHMKVEDAATGNTGVWITFIARRRRSTSASAVTTVLILRAMSRRFRERELRRRTTCRTGRAAPVRNRSPSEEIGRCR